MCRVNWEGGKFFSVWSSNFFTFNNYYFQNLSGFPYIRHHAVLELMVISNGARRHWVVCWLLTRPLICNCVVLGARLLHETIERKRQPKLTIDVGSLPLVCPHHRENARKWSFWDSPWCGSQWQVSFNGEVRESSWPMGPRARWHITVSLCAAIPRMRHSGVGKFASDQQGEGWAW